jgi:adenylosuccinate lyase
MREAGGRGGGELLDRLAADDRLGGLTRADLDALLADRLSFTGAAGDQIARVVARVEAVVRTDPDAAAYTPGSIL